jgi:hypothetical protein
VRHDVPGAFVHASRLGAALSLPSDVVLDVRVQAVEPGRVLLFRQVASSSATTHVLFPPLTLGPGGEATFALAASGTPLSDPWTLDVDGDGNPDGTLPPASQLPGTGSAPALPVPQPSVVLVHGMPAGAPVSTTLRLPETGTKGWTFAVTEETPWLGVTPAGGSAPGDLTLILDPADLQVGTHSAALNLQLAVGAYAISLNVPVTFLVGATTADEPAPGALPEILALHAPAPNPVGGRATIRYELPAAGPVRLAVYDALGREVAVLVDGERPAGVHAVVVDAGALAAGAYVVRIHGAGTAVARRLSVVR